MQFQINRPIFVYGSLRAGEFNYNRYLDGKVVTPIPSRARIKGTLYDMPYKGYPALLAEAFSTEWVYGEIFELLDHNATLAQLDELEGYHGINHPANEYERSIETVEVWQEESKAFVTQDVFVYLYRVENDSLFTKQTTVMKDGIWRESAMKEIIE